MRHAQAHPDARGPTQRRPLRSCGAWSPIALLWVAALVALGVPALTAVGTVVVRLGTPDGPQDALDAAALSGGAWTRLLLTIAIALLIGILASVAGMAPAWVLARAGRARAFWTALLITPVLLPSYLAYSAWGLLRAPLTPGAAWLERISHSWLPDAPVWAGRGVAILGLVLWSWPIAMLVAAPMLARIDRSLLEAARLWLPLAPRRRLLVRLTLPAALSATGVVTVVMLGSAVPLHLSQIETDAIRLWRLLLQTSADDAWTAWVGAWPSVLLAAASAGLLARTLAASRAQETPRPVGTDPSYGRHRWLAALASILVWGLSVAVPFYLFVTSIRQWNDIGRFWRLHAQALADSAAIGVCVGLLCAVLSGATAYALASSLHPWRVRAGRWLIGPFLFFAILPGVLVGSATLQGWSLAAGQPWLRWLTDSPAILVTTHVARFGALAMLAGALLASAEPRDLVAARSLDNAAGPRGWAITRPPGFWGTLVGVGTAAALLSIHEIESSVIVAPVGMESLARHLLDLLHFARDEELSVAAVWIMGLGLIPAALAGVALLASRPHPRRPLPEPRG